LGDALVQDLTAFDVDKEDNNEQDFRKGYRDRHRASATMLNKHFKLTYY
jgi:hypothetical protein